MFCHTINMPVLTVAFMYICLSVNMTVCLSVFMSVGLPVCIFIFMYLSTYLSCLSVHMSVCMYVYQIKTSSRCASLCACM